MRDNLFVGDVRFGNSAKALRLVYEKPKPQQPETEEIANGMYIPCKVRGCRSIAKRQFNDPKARVFGDVFKCGRGHKFTYTEPFEGKGGRKIRPDGKYGVKRQKYKKRKGGQV